MRTGFLLAGMFMLNISAGFSADGRTYPVTGKVSAPLPADELLAMFDKLENAEGVSEELLMETLHRMVEGGLPPAPNTVVFLKGENYGAQTTTDEMGAYRFENVPAGQYAVTATLPGIPTITPGVKRDAKAKITINVPQGGERNNNLRPSHLAVELHGRVLDGDGKPIAGAVVTGIEYIDAYREQYYSPGYVPTKWTAVTDAEGKYGFDAVEPENFFILAGALPSKSRNPRGFVAITVEADGYSIDNEKTKGNGRYYDDGYMVVDKDKGTSYTGGKILAHAVGEEVLFLARRMLKIFNAVNAANGKEPRVEDPGREFPQSKGNVITGVDIVMRAD